MRRVHIGRGTLILNNDFTGFHWDRNYFPPYSCFTLEENHPAYRIQDGVLYARQEAGNTETYTALTTLSERVREIQLLPGTTSVRDQVFVGKKLDKVTLPASLYPVPEAIFLETSIYQLFIEEGIPSLPVQVISLAREIHLPRSLQALEGGTLEKADSCERTFYVPDEAPVCKVLEEMQERVYVQGKPERAYAVKDGMLTEIPREEKILRIPAKVGEEAVQGIADALMEKLRVVEDVYVPGNIRILPTNFLRFCQNLKSVHLDMGVEEIGEGAFMTCPELQTIDIPASVKIIKEEKRSHSGNQGALTGCTIYGEHGSFAENYAERIGAFFVDRSDNPEEQEKASHFLYSCREDGNMCVTGCRESGPESDTVIPDRIQGRKVTEVRLRGRHMGKITIGKYVESFSMEIDRLTGWVMTKPIGMAEINTLFISPDNPYLEMDGNLLYKKEPKALVGIVHLDENMKKLVVRDGTSYVRLPASVLDFMEEIWLPRDIQDIDHDRTNYTVKEKKIVYGYPGKAVDTGFGSHKAAVSGRLGDPYLEGQGARGDSARDCGRGAHS